MSAVRVLWWCVGPQKLVLQSVLSAAFWERGEEIKKLDTYLSILTDIPRTVKLMVKRYEPSQRRDSQRDLVHASPSPPPTPPPCSADTALGLLVETGTCAEKQHRRSYGVGG